MILSLCWVCQRRITAVDLTIFLREEINCEHRRCAVGACQAGRHPVAAALRNAAQGGTGSAEIPAARSEHAGALSPTAREIYARPQAHRLLRRASPCRGHP